jgi:hypothetical protein
MPLNKRNLYTILITGCIAGYIWLYYGMTFPPDHVVDVCLFKRIADIPCPSCGATRSVVSLIHGDLIKALYINPLGLVVAGVMLLTPFWLLADLVTKRESLLNVFRHTERLLKKPGVAIPLVLLLVINWIWNIAKEL